VLGLQAPPEPVNTRSFLSSRLYNQIVYPLVAASIVVGVVATLVAVYFLSNLTTKWVEQTAIVSTQTLSKAIGNRIAQMQHVAQFAADSSEVAAAASTGDAKSLDAWLDSRRDLQQFDAVFVLDPAGRAVAVNGQDEIMLGAFPFGHEAMPQDSTRVGLYRLGASRRLTVMERIGSGSNAYTLALTDVVDHEYITSFGLIEDSAFCIYSARGDRVAVAYGRGLSLSVMRELGQTTRRTSPEIAEAIAIAPRGSVSMRVENAPFEVHAEPIVLPSEVYAGTFGYVVGIVSQGVSQEAGRTTINLIMMWSIFAIVALVGLGGWIARRVSEPLVELSAGARRIADGDFDTKVYIRGSNEIAQLAHTFNDMTDSLRDRSESLTKKVLELATLYEMSRSLGATLDLDELLSSVLDSALRIFDLELGYVALRDRDAGDVSIRTVRSSQPESADGAVHSSMSEWVVREGRPLIFNPDAGSKGGQIDLVTGARAALCVPLMSSEGTIGSITIGSSDTRYRFNSDDVRLLSTIANHATIAIDNIELFTSLQEAYLATVRSLAAAVDAKDSYTRGHSERVATYAIMIAERMGLSHEQRIALEMAAYLHDIGKIGVREEILLKPGDLDELEMAQMRHHPLIGANILKPVAFPWAITPVVRHHHESYDGTGYPAGLRGEEIPLLARILTVADSFEAMTSSRPYREGMNPGDAVAELNKCAGKQFDPKVVEVFVDVIAEMERSGDPTRPESVDEVLPEEARGIFSALLEGLFASFRRLGGPRLSSNVESEIDDYLVSESMPFRISRGRVSFVNDSPGSIEDEIDEMRVTLRHIDEVMARVSGAALVEHFYDDAFKGLSARMRYLAKVLGFAPS
jgi:putative nucleotidyltransferase with HDIG domain